MGTLGLDQGFEADLGGENGSILEDGEEKMEMSEACLLLEIHFSKLMLCKGGHADQVTIGENCAVSSLTKGRLFDQSYEAKEEYST